MNISTSVLYVRVLLAKNTNTYFFDVNKQDVEGTRQKRLVVSDRVTAYTTVARTFPEL
jgi:hypothetical protein